MPVFYHVRHITIYRSKICIFLPFLLIQSRSSAIYGMKFGLKRTTVPGLPYDKIARSCCCYAPAHREGGNKRCFCPSVTYIANNSRTQRPSVPKFGRKVPHLWCNLHTSFKVKRSKVKVTRSINADTHPEAYLPNSKVYKLQTWCTDGGLGPVSATGAMTKVKGQGRKVTWSCWAVLARCCTCVIRGRWGHTVSAEAGGHTSC